MAKSKAHLSVFDPTDTFRNQLLASAIKCFGIDVKFSLVDVLTDGWPSRQTIASNLGLHMLVGLYPPDPRPTMETMKGALETRRIVNGGPIQTRFLADPRDLPNMGQFDIAVMRAVQDYKGTYSVTQMVWNCAQPKYLIVAIDPDKNETPKLSEDIQSDWDACVKFASAYRMDYLVWPEASAFVFSADTSRLVGLCEILGLPQERVIRYADRKTEDGKQILELGAGNRPTPGCTVYHDRIVHSKHIDIGHDLDYVPWPWIDEQFDAVIALDVMEHLHLEVQQWLDECWRILKPGGKLMLRLPQWNNPVSYRDPTHVRVFHPETLHYWDKRTQLHKDYGCIYFAESNKWWIVSHVDPNNNGGDLAFELIKVVDDDSGDGSGSVS